MSNPKCPVCGSETIQAKRRMLARCPGDCPIVTWDPTYSEGYD